MPWRNGGGITHELAAHTGPDGVLLWRVSVADIARDGPFSAFPGFDRQTAVMSGEGLRLGPMTILAGQVAAYAGETPAECTLVAGPVRVLNAFSARNRVSAQVGWRNIQGETLVGETVAVCVDGQVSCGNAILRANDSLRVDQPLAVRGTGTLLVIGFQVSAVIGAP